MIADYVVATEPIPDLLEEIGWTSHVGIADGREWLYYLRPTDDGRIVIGGGAGSAVYGGPRQRSRRDRHAARRGGAGARLLWMFPQLADVRFTHAWGGPIDQTPTFVPFYRTLDPGNVHAGLGYSGHGLIQTYIGGHILASTALGIPTSGRRCRQSPGDREGAAGAVPVPARPRGGVRARARRRAAGRGPGPWRAVRPGGRPPDPQPRAAGTPGAPPQ